MAAKIIYSTLFLVCIALGSLTGAPLQYENQVVEEITVEVANMECGDFDSTAIIARMKTTEDDLFSQIDFDNDLKMLVQEYDRVEPKITSVEGKLYISLKIWPRPTISSIGWNGCERVSPKKLQEELEIKVGAVFDRQCFNKAFNKLKTYYVKKGYFEASLDYTVNLDPVTNTVDIHIFVTEGRAGRIQKICFKNFGSAEKEALLEKIMTKTYFTLTSWYTGEGTYNEEMMQQDRFVILNFLQNEGYADATVDIDICESPIKDNRIIITISAERGEVYYFGPITFEGNKLYCDEEIENQIRLMEGNSFSPEAIRQTVENLTNFYGRHGYIDAVIDYETKLDCENRAYAVNFTIEEGEQYRVGLIKVFGNCSTQTSVILHETLLVPGEIFNSVKLELTENRLENIGYFKNVNVYAVRSEGPGGLGGHYRDVHIEVEETVTGNFGAGFGLSSVESIFGEFRITERNFNYQGLGCVWKDGLRVLRGGGEYLSFNAMIGYKSRKYSMSWTKPYFKDTNWVVGIELQQSNNRYISDDYQINAAGITLHGAYPLNPFLRLGLHYRLTYSDIDLDEHRIRKDERRDAEKAEAALEAGDLSKAREYQHKERKLSCQLKEEARNAGAISAIGLNLSYDSTDHPANPHRGFKSRLEQEVAGFGGNQSFMSFAYLNKYFIPAGDLAVIKFRADMRFIVPLFDTKRYHIPIDERLFLGGDSTIRGYKVYRLGPQYNEGDPRGGMSLQLLSAEYYRQVHKRVGAFIFCDSGHLSFDVWNFGTMWTSVGFGFNLQILDSTPPIVVGMGFPLNPDHRGDVKRFFFSLGGTF